MSEHVKVKEVSGGKPWNDLVYYDIVFDRNGSDFECSWGKKSEGAPEVGDELEGEFFEKKDGEWGFRLSKGKPGGSSPRPSGGSTSSASTGKSPDVQRQIIRQHSQEMALRFIALADSPDHDGELSRVFLLADRFDADVLGQVASEGPGSGAAGDLSSPAVRGESEPASHPQPATNEHEWFMKLLGDAGLQSDPAHKLATLIVEKFKPEQIRKAEVGLGDIQTMAGTLAELEKVYRLTKGEILVAEPSDDDTPF